MQCFRAWLEEVEKDQDFYNRFFLSLWDLRPGGEGLSMNLQGFDVDRLTNSGEFQALDPEKQQTIIHRIQQGNGTVGDLAAIATSGAPA